MVGAGAVEKKYGSGSGSDVKKNTAPAPAPTKTLRLRRLRLRLRNPGSQVLNSSQPAFFFLSSNVAEPTESSYMHRLNDWSDTKPLPE